MTITRWKDGLLSTSRKFGAIEDSPMFDNYTQMTYSVEELRSMAEFYVTRLTLLGREYSFVDRKPSETKDFLFSFI